MKSVHVALSSRHCRPPASKILDDMSEHIHKSTYSPEPRDIIFTIPNALSLLRIISIPIVAWLISRHSMIVALIVFAFSAITDFLDGTLARKLNQVSKLGQILDPCADRLLIFCTILALGVAGIIPWWIFIVVVARDVIMGIEILWLAQYGYGPLPVHFVGKAATALLMISMVALVVADIGIGAPSRILHLFALAVGIWGVVLYYLAGFIYLCQGSGVIRKELRARKEARR